MSHDESVTRWIGEVKEGDSQAAKAIWEHYFAKVVEVARKHLKNSACRISDEEDVALSVLNKFFQSAEDGKYPDLSDRDGLWRLLIKMTANKSVDLHRKETRQRRGGGNVRGDSIAGNEGHLASDVEFAEFMGSEPTPEFVAIMAEQLTSLLDRFEDPEIKELVIGKIEGYSNEDLAERLKVSSRTIERRLRLVRECCRQDLESD